MKNELIDSIDEELAAFGRKIACVEGDPVRKWAAAVLLRRLHVLLGGESVGK